MRDHVHRRGAVLPAAAVAAAALTISALSGIVAPSAQASATRPARVSRAPARRAAATSASVATEGPAAADPFTTPSMSSYLRGRQGDITAAVHDLVNRELYLYRPGVTEQTARIVKVDILGTLLHEEQAAFRPPDEDDEALATGMIEESDNDDATDPWDEVGGSRAVAHFDALAGLTDTTPNAAGYWGETMTTALDQVRLLERLVLANSLLDDAARSYELGIMENVVPYERWGVSAGPPAGVTVALKNGWVPIVDGNWQINSIGYVDGQGRVYIIAVPTNENLTEDYGITTIEGISRIVWSRLAPPGKR